MAKRSLPESAGIYGIKSKISGKYYVGRSLNIPKRFKSHLRNLKGNKHDNYLLQQEWNLHGPDNFELEILDTSANTRNKLERLEIQWIKEFREKDISLNISNGGKSAVEHTLSEIRRGKYDFVTKKMKEDIYAFTKKKIKYGEISNELRKMGYQLPFNIPVSYVLILRKDFIVKQVEEQLAKNKTIEEICQLLNLTERKIELAYNEGFKQSFGKKYGAL
jgi:group I intron endonuclease